MNEDQITFVKRVAELGTVFLARPGRGDLEFIRPKGWPDLDPAGNSERLRSYRPGDGIVFVTNERVAVIDVDTKNGANLDQVADWLNELDILTYAYVHTPSGGAHIYIDGHADLPNIAADSGRDGLVGLPGVEIAAHRRAVFLPGTVRPKYDGAGYRIEFDELDQLGSGGPAATDRLLTWIADHRVRPAVKPFTPSIPWRGGTPTDREAKYLEAALTGQVDEIASMGPNTGRNYALYTAALKLGNYVAGAGLEEGRVEAALVDAARSCGLLDEDGQPAVLATIRSGLAIGKKMPKAVPPLTKTTTSPEVNPKPEPRRTVDAPPTSLADAHEVFTRWLGDDYDIDALNAVLATAAVEKLDGDPLWLLLISGSGNAKTETAQCLAGAGAIVTSTVSSTGALLSATSRKDVAKDATGGLLRKIGDDGVLVIKDVTSILSMNKDARAEVLAALREVYDGKWSRNVGTDGGRTLEWDGRIAVVGAVTTAWDKAHAAIASMGDRFVLCRMDSTTGRQVAGRRAIGNTGQEVQMRSDLTQAAAGVLAGVDPSTAITPTDAETDVLLAAADLVTLARTGVEYDYRGDVIDAHAPEMPTRFAKQLAQVLRGGVAIGMERADALRLAIRCARDSMPPLRLAIVDDLAAHPESSTAEVRKRLGKPRATVDRQLQALHMLEVIECDESSAPNGATVWRYSLASGVDSDALNPQKQCQKS